MPRETLRSLRIDTGFDHVRDKRVAKCVEIGVEALVVDVRDAGNFQVTL